MATTPAPSSASTKEPEAHAPRTCSGCGHAVPEAADRCPSCGLAFGEDQRCPHCAAIAPVEKSAKLRTLCSVCGRPRIRVAGLPADLGLSAERNERYVAALRGAGHRHHIAATWRAIGFAAIGFGLLGSLVLAAVLSVAPAGTVGAVVAVIAALVPIVVGTLSLARGRAAHRESVALLDDAWSEAVTALAGTREGRIDARTLAAATLIEETAAESLLGQLTVKDRLAREVTGEGGLSYKLVDDESDARKPPARVAADPGGSPSSSSPDEAESDDALARTSGRQGAGP